MYGLGKSVSEGRLTASNPALSVAEQIVRHLNIWDEAAIETAIDGYTRLPQPPTIVLLGSSLMMYPFWYVDSEPHPHCADSIVEHHHAEALQARLRKVGLARSTVYNLATPLQMVSDSYMYACNYLKGSKAPRAIVIGVSPREFYDSEFKSAEDTVNFTDQGWNVAGKHIARFYFRSWEQYADFTLRKLSFLYGQRSVMQQFLAARLLSMYGQSVGTGAQSTFGLCKFKQHYAGIGTARLHAQYKFLQRLCGHCRAQNIKIILVNMPIPRQNRALLPPGLYTRYESDLGKLASQEHIAYLNLAERREFAGASNFVDAVHMNQFGGERLINDLLPTIKAQLR